MSTLFEITNGTFIPHNAIFYVTKEGDYILAYTDEKREYKVRCSLADIWEKIKEDTDLKFAHRSHIIRKSCIAELVEEKDSAHIVWRENYKEILISKNPSLFRTVPVSKEKTYMFKEAKHDETPAPQLFYHPLQLRLFPELFE